MLAFFFWFMAIWIVQIFADIFRPGEHDLVTPTSKVRRRAPELMF
jgi:hypothetical protein